MSILIVSIYLLIKQCAKGACYNTLQKQLSFGFFTLYLVILIVSIFSEMLKQCAKRACYNTLQKHDLLTALPFEDNKFDCLISVAVTTYLSKYFLKINGKVLIRPVSFISFKLRPFLSSLCGTNVQMYAGSSKNLSIYNIICWVAGLFAQMNQRPSVFCSKHFFFIISNRLRALKLIIFIFVKL